MRPRRPWLLVSLACLVPAVLDALQTYLQARLGAEPRVPWGAIVFSGGEWLFLGALTPIAFVLARRFPLRRETLGRALAAHAGGALLLCLGWASLGILLGAALRRYPANGPLPRAYLSWILTSVPWSVFMYFAVLGCVYAFTYFVEARAREAQAARLSAQLSDARLGALRMQINPHFLFNSLNAVTVLVRDANTTAATRMLELLSDTLRQLLRHDDRHEIPLARELHFLEQYLAIEQIRFSDRLRVHFDIEPGLDDAAVPSFILQPLVENAVRHGIARRIEAGAIEIVARRDAASLVLSVRDDGAGPGEEAVRRPATGVGLTNVRERLATLYGPAASLTLTGGPGQGTTATIRLPYRRLAAAPEQVPNAGSAPDA